MFDFGTTLNSLPQSMSTGMQQSQMAPFQQMLTRLFGGMRQGAQQGIGDLRQAIGDFSTGMAPTGPAPQYPQFPRSSMFDPRMLTGSNGPLVNNGPARQAVNSPLPGNRGYNSASR